MKELSLFSGAGGGLLASKYFLGWKTIGYVEKNEYCQKVIKQRITDGLLDNAPIFGDIRVFIDQGYAESYTGMVDVVSAGFPCQPFSIAGKRRAEKDNRNMWPQTIKSIQIIRPKLVFLENVPGIISSGYIFTVIRQLSKAGYEILPLLQLGACDVGAPHKRKRSWVVAYAKRMRELQSERSKQNKRRWPCNCGKKVSHSNKQHGDSRRFYTGKVSQFKASEIQRCESDVCNPAGKRLQDRFDHAMGRCSEGNKELQLARPNWWATEPSVGRVVNGLANRVDRLKAIGNGQVPQVAATAWNFLTKYKKS